MRLLMPEMAGEISEKSGLSVVKLLRQCARNRLENNKVTTSSNDQISKKRLRYEANKTKEQISRNPIILEAIFRHLDPGDVLRVALVCRTWNDVVEQPRSEWGTLIGRDESRYCALIGSDQTQLSYTIRTQLMAFKAPYLGHFLPFAVSLWLKDRWLPCTERICRLSAI